VPALFRLCRLGAATPQSPLARLRIARRTARSQHGNTARKQDLLTELRYVQVGFYRLQEALDQANQEQLREFKSALKTLRTTMGDLARKLRKVISGPSGVLFEATHHDYQTPLTVGFLIKDQNEKLRFRND
jgi:hypothetical protein